MLIRFTDHWKDIIIGFMGDLYTKKEKKYEYGDLAKEEARKEAQAERDKKIGKVAEQANFKEKEKDEDPRSNNSPRSMASERLVDKDKVSASDKLTGDDNAAKKEAEDAAKDRAANKAQKDAEDDYRKKHGGKLPGE